jgi:hypothetical protein
MDIGPLNNTMNQNFSGANNVARPEAAPIRKSDVEQAPVQIPAVESIDIKMVDQKKMEAMRDALRKAFSNSYVVSDRSFTIYKDMSGQYITRFTNLRDGTVTYVPEPEILQHIAMQGIDPSVVTFSA